MKKYLWMSSAAVVIGVLRVKIYLYWYESIEEYLDKLGSHDWFGNQSKWLQNDLVPILQ